MADGSAPRYTDADLELATKAIDDAYYGGYGKWPNRDAIFAAEAKAVLDALAEAGRLRPAGQVKISEALEAEAQRLYAEDFRPGRVGIEYINGWEDAATRAAKIEEGSDG